MAGETLLTVAQTVASMPDNTVGAITAQATRSMIISEALGLGFYSVDAPFNVPITDGVYTNIPLQALGVTDFNNLAFELDGNNAWRSDYSGVIIPGGLIRLVIATTRIQVVKAGGGTADSYVFQYHVNGLPVGNDIPVDIGTDEEYNSFAESIPYEVVLAEPIDLRVKGVGTNDDLLMTDYRFTVTGAQL